MGLQVISDFQGRDIDDPKVQAEYNEIREGVIADVSDQSVHIANFKRAVGDRSYKALWTRYRSRVLIAMSSQLFAQLNGINVISYYARELPREASLSAADNPSSCT